MTNMGLTSSLQIGRSGLLASQTGIEVTGNNLSNVTTAGYHRQSVTLAPARSHEMQRGVFLGQGVEVQQIVRHVNEALEGRIRNGIADQSFSLAEQGLLEQIEAIQNELSEIDLTTYLNEFFNAWSELANTPEDNAVRTVVVQQGNTLASFIQTLRGDLTDQRTQLDNAIDNAAIATDDLLTRIAEINIEISKAESGSGGAHGLRDQRDALLTELSGFLEISTVEQNTGAVDVFVGSLPIILNNVNRGVELEKESVNGKLVIDVIIKADGSSLNPTSGQLASLFLGREQHLNNAIDVLDQFASQLIFEVNKIHSQGQAVNPTSSITGTVRADDPTVVLNDPASGLDFIPTHGSFQLHVTQESTGQRNTSTIDIDLDGINAASDTTLNSLAAAINSVANVNAIVTPDGRLQIAGATNDFQLSFSDDSSGALAALGINTFFSGSNATDIQLNAVVQSDPGKITTAQGHVLGDNRSALAMTELRDQGVATLNGFSLSEFWNRHIQDYAVRTAQAQQKLDADTVVRENLEAQQQSLSGVNADEEAINLLVFQRAYQGSARFLSVVDELLQTLLALL